MATKLLLVLIIFSMLNVKSFAQTCNCEIYTSMNGGKYTDESCTSWKAYVTCRRPCNVNDEEIVKTHNDGQELRAQCGMPGSSSKSVPSLFAMASVLLGLYLAHCYGKPE